MTRVYIDMWEFQGKIMAKCQGLQNEESTPKEFSAMDGLKPVIEKYLTELAIKEGGQQSIIVREH